MRLIGDVHDKFDRYENIIKQCDVSIQVGDFGIGFGDEPPTATMQNAMPRALSVYQNCFMSISINRF